MTRAEWGTERDSGCDYDYIEVTAGHTKTKYCGSTSYSRAFPAAMNVTGTTSFRWKTDGSTNGVGFKLCAARLTSGDPPCPLNPPPVT